MGQEYTVKSPTKKDLKGSYPFHRHHTAPVLPQLQETDYVYISKGVVGSPLLPLYQGPCKDISRSQKCFGLKIGGRTEVVSVDRLEPHLGKAPFITAIRLHREVAREAKVQ
jgi:hypothetical protein